MLSYYLYLSVMFLIKITCIWGSGILGVLGIFIIVRTATKDESIITKLFIKISKL
ncbi:MULTISPECIES: hypothetical protein [Clostridium]|uniref:hypothetical protein n=1 Tax=Clostridium TaxID=1485 RepID=UPI00290EB023|nr:hypothetical protein [Clostridium sp.]MDU7948742.1 hypothetical protein [Clostridium sp.]